MLGFYSVIIVCNPVVYVWANKTVVGVALTSAWSFIAQIEPITLPPGGQWTIQGLLLSAVLFLYRELKAERKNTAAERESREASQEKLLNVLREVADNHREDESKVRADLRDALLKNNNGTKQ